MCVTNGESAVSWALETDFACSGVVSTLEIIMLFTRELGAGRKGYQPKTGGAASSYSPGRRGFRVAPPSAVAFSESGFFVGFFGVLRSGFFVISRVYVRRSRALKKAARRVSN